MITPKKKIRSGDSVWLSQRLPKIPSTPLEKDCKTDIVIIGAGITGAMAAEELSAVGFDVILLDRRGPLKGATTATTALLQYEIDNPLITLQKQIGHAKATRAWRRSKLGLESLAAKIQSLNIDCNFKRKTSLYLAGNELNAQQLKQEWSARKNIGIHTDYLAQQPLLDHYGIKRSAALLSFDNLSVNPLKLAAGFLTRAIEQGVKIHAPMTVDAVEPGRAQVRVVTKEGPVITAKHVIYATGYEMPTIIPHNARHTLHSTYAIATKPQRDKLWPEECLIWEASDPYLYMRTTADGRVICGGEDDAFESTEKRDALLPKKTLMLEKKLQAIFPQLDCGAEYAWCGSFGASKTGLPSIGHIPGMKNCYAILAFGGNGITFSRIAAEMLTSELTGTHDPDADLFAFG